MVGAVTGHPTPQGKVGHPPYGLSLYAGSLLLRANFEERRKAKVQLPRMWLLGTRAKLFRRWGIRQNPGTSLRRSMPEDSPTPTALPCSHL